MRADTGRPEQAQAIPARIESDAGTARTCSGLVKALRQEAVGMYEVAVLEAGSSAALRRWLDEHKYKYPEGMDKPVDDYVDEGWCFVDAVTGALTKYHCVRPRSSCDRPPSAPTLKNQKLCECSWNLLDLAHLSRHTNDG